MNEIENQDRRKLAVGEIFFNNLFFDFQDSAPRRGGGILIFRTGGVVKFAGCDLPPSEGGVEISLPVIIQIL